MNLISCTGCGVVLDKDKLHFPEADPYDETHTLKEGIEATAVWSHKHNDYVAFINCPVCKEKVLEK